MFNTLDDALFWCLILMLRGVQNALFKIAAKQYIRLFMLNFDAWFWCLILTLDFDAWIKRRYERMDIANSRVALRLKTKFIHEIHEIQLDTFLKSGRILRVRWVTKKVLFIHNELKSFNQQKMMFLAAQKQYAKAWLKTIVKIMK